MIKSKFIKFGGAFLVLAISISGYLGCTQKKGALDESHRQTISLDRDWKFHQGQLELPGRTNVTGWHYRMEPKGELAARDSEAAMSAIGVDMSATGWKAGTRFQFGEDTNGKEWILGGNLPEKGSILYAWFRAELPGEPARRPALEFEKMTGHAFVYVNGVKVAEHNCRAEMLTVDMTTVWKADCKNVIAILIRAKNWGTLGNSVTYVDLDSIKVPVDNHISPKFDDHTWMSVDVPHDYVVEGPIGNTGADGYRRDVGWYRKSFIVPSVKPGSRTWLEFDGVYRMSRYWLNGEQIAVHPSGYSLCRIDITDKVKSGRNTLVVGVDPTLSEGWWYDGGGIYRHVRMVVASDIYVAPDGVFVSSAIPDCRDGVAAPATLNVALEIDNSRKEAVSANIKNEVLDAAGEVVLTDKTRQELAVGKNYSKLALEMSEAKLWSCEHPELYTLRTTISLNGKVVDAVSTSFAVRKVEFHGERGFLLNDRVVKLKGTCNHESHAGVGVAIPDRLHVWRLEQLKKMGCNAIRCAHNMNAPIVYETCDRLGILVMDEFRIFGDSYNMKAPRDTKADQLKDQTVQIKRNRNHPSIIIWSIGNEEGNVNDNEDGARIATSIKALVNKLDGTRMTTMAAVHGWNEEGVCGVVDVVGINYSVPQFDKIRETFPKKPIVGTEACSEVSTRGFYDRTQFKNPKGGPTLYGDQKLGYLSNYSENGPGWWQSSEVNWKAVTSRPWMSGTFVWTGFDYKGEPTPFGQPNQPSISSAFGIMDVCGFPKDSYYYYKSWWSSEPVIHVFPHWNWPGKEGQEIKVWVHSNSDEVELFLNGKSLGKKEMERNSHLEWMVPYATGKLEAKGFSKGKEISDSVETTGAPSGLALAPDRPTLIADGADLAWVAVSVVDAQGRMVPTAGNMVRFSVSGPGKILGVGNGDPACHEPDKASQRSAFNGLCMVLLQTSREAGDIVLTAESDGLDAVSVTLKSI